MDNQTKKVWTISELNGEIKAIFTNCFPYGLWLAGEVSNLTVHQSGHVYLTLKDSRSQISATWFGGATQARQLGIKNGMQVEALGMLS
ncbi:MAG: exodeoxyribonuclease VII large subunit, partial [Lentisphaeria bacterium]